MTHSPHPDTFPAWFGRSAVVDAFGAPKTVYHGTASAFTRFDPQRIGEQDDHAATWLGLHFTASREAAEHYASQAGGAIVMEVYLSLQKPMRYTAEEYADLYMDITYGDAQVWKIRENLERAGYDGFIVEGDALNGTHYIVFEPEQIRPAQPAELRQQAGLAAASVAVRPDPSSSADPAGSPAP